MKKDRRWKNTTVPSTMHAPSSSSFQNPVNAIKYTGITESPFLYKYHGLFRKHSTLSTSGWLIVTISKCTQDDLSDVR